MTDNQKANIILKEVCLYFKQPVKAVKSRGRKREIVLPRHFAMFMIQKHTEMSLSQIGDFCGKYDHATVINAVKMINNLVEVNGGALQAGEINSRVERLIYGINQMCKVKRRAHHYRNMFRKSRRNKLITIMK